MGAYDVTVICVYNNVELVDQMRAGIDCSGLNCQMVLLENRSGEYQSAAEALNVGLAVADAPVVVFLHQDVEFSGGGFADFVRAVEHAEPGLYGLAGTNSPHRDRRIVSSMWEGPDCDFRHGTLKEPLEEVMTLDECLVASKLQTLRQSGLSFDERVCDGWHFYVVDLCLQARRVGIPSYVVRTDAWHKSGGKVDASFYRAAWRVSMKYRGELDEYTSTCGWFPTNPVLLAAVLLRRMVLRI